MLIVYFDKIPFFLKVRVLLVTNLNSAMQHHLHQTLKKPKWDENRKTGNFAFLNQPRYNLPCVTKGQGACQVI